MAQDQIHQLATQAASAKEECRVTDMVKLYDQACRLAPLDNQSVRRAFLEAGVRVDGQPRSFEPPPTPGQYK